MQERISNNHNMSRIFYYANEDLLNLPSGDYFIFPCVELTSYLLFSVFRYPTRMHIEENHFSLVNFQDIFFLFHDPLCPDMFSRIYMGENEFY